VPFFRWTCVSHLPLSWLPLHVCFWTSVMVSNKCLLTDLSAPQALVFGLTRLFHACPSWQLSDCWSGCLTNSIRALADFLCICEFNLELRDKWSQSVCVLVCLSVMYLLVIHTCAITTVEMLTCSVFCNDFHYLTWPSEAWQTLRAEAIILKTNVDYCNCKSSPVWLITANSMPKVHQSLYQANRLASASKLL